MEIHGRRRRSIRSRLAAVNIRAFSLEEVFSSETFAFLRDGLNPLGFIGLADQACEAL
jgi:hypothetical protein